MSYPPKLGIGGKNRCVLGSCKDPTLGVCLWAEKCLKFCWNDQLVCNGFPLNRFEHPGKPCLCVIQQLLREIPTQADPGITSAQVKQLIYQGKNNMDALRLATGGLEQEEQERKADLLARRERVQRATTLAILSEWIEEDLDGQLPAENQHQMKLLRGRVLRMEALINGLLDYSRAGRKQVDIESVAVGPLLTEIIDSLAPPDTFTITIAPDMPVLNTKRVLLRQVFANLISNAIKHHHDGNGQIQIAVQDRGDRYEFSVTDDAPGIDPAFHDKIFVIFQTLEARDTKESTGVGLAIVKKNC